MSKRIDLDELERTARAVIAGAETFLENANRHHERELASPPEVIIALVARIRELEDALADAAEVFGGQAPRPNAFAWRALRDKGVVIP